MSLPNELLPVGLLGKGPAGGYQISRSLRFNSADSAYLNRAPTATSTSSTTCTLSFWMKRSALSDGRPFSLGPLSGVVNTLIIQILSNTIGAYFITNGANSQFTTSVLRDPSAWYHIVFRIDTTQATASNRCRIYINGIEQTGLTGTAPPQNHSINWGNSGQASWVGGDTVSGQYFSGYLADVHFIDGQSLDPTIFGQFDSNGVWQPKSYSGTYGTNGFRLDFSDNSSATSTGIGKDVSGNGNNWSPNNFSVTSGAGNDSLVDSPTNYGTDTGAGGEVRGNYCTLNPLSQSGSNTVSNGNLDVTVAAGTSNTIVGTVGLTSGKWYWEVTPTALTTAAGVIGVGDLSVPPSSRNYQGSGWYYVSDGTKYNNNSGSAYGASYAVNDVIGVALDMDAGTLVFYKNGVSQGTAYSTGLSGKTLAPVLNNGTNSASQSYVCNFGQRPFAYAAPSGFKALCSQNLPTPTIPNGRTAMDVVTYTGNGGTQTISGLSFSPDLVWIKQRSSNVDDHIIKTSLQTKFLSSNQTFGERGNDNDLITSLDVSGFTLNSTYLGGANNSTNGSGITFVAWAWDAGTSTVTNTAGTITSQVRANASAGISIVSWTGTTTGTIGHGLGVAPSLIIAKSRSSSATGWIVYSKVFGTNYYLILNQTDAVTYSGSYWGASDPSSSTFGVIGTGFWNNNGSMIAYCFAPVSGFSAFGSYTGNGSADGPFIYTNMRPRWILIKRTDTTENWILHDTARDPFNVTTAELLPNSSTAEGNTTPFDILSNGFKIRTGTNIGLNANAGTYIYAAFAENPFTISRAR